MKEEEDDDDGVRNGGGAKHDVSSSSSEEEDEEAKVKREQNGLKTDTGENGFGDGGGGARPVQPQHQDFPPMSIYTSEHMTLLRAIQEGEVDPVGSPKPVKADFRLISASRAKYMSLVLPWQFQ